MKKWILILIVIVSACKSKEQEKEENLWQHQTEAINRGFSSDTIFMGLYLGMSSQEFYHVLETLRAGGKLNADMEYTLQAEKHTYTCAPGVDFYQDQLYNFELYCECAEDHYSNMLGVFDIYNVLKKKYHFQEYYVDHRELIDNYNNYLFTSKNTSLQVSVMARPSDVMISYIDLAREKEKNISDQNASSAKAEESAQDL